jgi:hypothetical protein
MSHFVKYPVVSVTYFELIILVRYDAKLLNAHKGLHFKAYSETNIWPKLIYYVIDLRVIPDAKLRYLKEI